MSTRRYRKSPSRGPRRRSQASPVSGRPGGRSAVVERTCSRRAGCGGCAQSGPSAVGRAGGRSIVGCPPVRRRTAGRARARRCFRLAARAGPSAGGLAACRGRRLARRGQRVSPAFRGPALAAPEVPRSEAASGAPREPGMQSAGREVDPPWAGGRAPVASAVVVPPEQSSSQVTPQGAGPEVSRSWVAHRSADADAVPRRRKIPGSTLPPPRGARSVRSRPAGTSTRRGRPVVVPPPLARSFARAGPS